MYVPDWFPYSVSRETMEKLARYVSLIEKWTASINLISKSSVSSIEIRHIWDSGQIFRPMSGCWLDFGSGGGLPGIVVAILAQDHEGPTSTVLVESDQRKCTFLRTCVRELDLSVQVVSQRIEDAPPQNAEILSARALAGLGSLLSLSVPHLAPGGTCIFMKGASWRTEIELAKKKWRFSCEETQSNTNSEAVILRIRDIERV